MIAGGVLFVVKQMERVFVLAAASNVALLLALAPRPTSTVGSPQPTVPVDQLVALKSSLIPARMIGLWLDRSGRPEPVGVAPLPHSY